MNKFVGTIAATSIAGLVLTANVAKAAKGEEHHCKNSCAGKNDCKTKESSCNGKASCAGKSFLKAKDEAECKTKGGTWAMNDKKDEKKPAKK